MTHHALTRLSLFAAVGTLALPAFAQDGETFAIDGTAGTALSAQSLGTYDEPWAMSFLPDGALLVTTRPGAMYLVAEDGTRTEIEGVPEVAYGGQGGLGDVVPAPDFADSGTLWFSHAESGDGGYGAVVKTATLDRSGDTPRLTDVQEVWRQQPFVSGQGHYSHRIHFGPAGSDQDGKVFITSGDRQKQDPAQDMEVNLGKLVRLNVDGTVPDDNPFQDEGELARTFWSVGHRNLLGIDFAPDGTLWEIEMGPRGGDELNRVVAGENYGWPLVSNGRNYSGSDIPDHSADDPYVDPVVSWTPVISPGDLEIYEGDLFTDWQGDGLAAGLSSQALVAIAIDGESASESERFEWGTRVRSVREGPDGAVYVLEDGAGGRLLKLTPAGSDS